MGQQVKHWHGKDSANMNFNLVLPLTATLIKSPDLYLSFPAVGAENWLSVAALCSLHIYRKQINTTISVLCLQKLSYQKKKTKTETKAKAITGCFCVHTVSEKPSKTWNRVSATP